MFYLEDAAGNLTDDPFSTYRGYRIKLLIAIEKNGVIRNKNEIFLNTRYRHLHDAYFDIEMDIKNRLRDQSYFRTNRIGFNLVHYSECATLNTFMAYRIMPLKKNSTTTENANEK